MAVVTFVDERLRQSPPRAAWPRCAARSAGSAALPAWSVRGEAFGAVPCNINVDPKDSGLRTEEHGFVRFELDRNDLFTAAPSKVGSLPVAPSQGAVVQNQEVDFSVTSTQIAANSPVFFGIFALSTSGVGYWNLNGTYPPLLIIEYQ